MRYMSILVIHIYRYRKENFPCSDREAWNNREPGEFEGFEGNNLIVIHPRDTLFLLLFKRL